MSVKILVKSVTTQKEISQCHLLFVGKHQQDQLKQILTTATASHVLTAGETPEFSESGGAITFSFERDKLRFEINVRTAERTELKVSSKLLALARDVVR